MTWTCEQSPPPHLPAPQWAPHFLSQSSKTHFSEDWAQLDLPAAWEETSSQRSLNSHPDPLPSACCPRGSRGGSRRLSPAWWSSASALFLVNTYVNLPLPPDSGPHGLARRPLWSLPVWQVATMFRARGGWPSSAWVWGESWAWSSQSGETVLSTPDKTDAEVRSEPGEEPAGPGQIT